MTEEEIEKMRKQIAGVLVTYPFTWYLNALNSLGFQARSQEYLPIGEYSTFTKDQKNPT